MARYILKRLGQSIFVLAGLTIVVFIVSRQIGDAARLMLPIDATEDQYLELRHQIGADQPLYVQFFHYVVQLMHGDFGMSLWQNVPAMNLVLSRFPATLMLTVSTIVLALVLAFPIGIAAALKPGSIFDRLAAVLSIFGLSVPSFWLALMLIAVLSIQLGLLRTSGYGGVQYLIMPTLALASQSIGRLAQVIKTSMLDVLTAPYLVTARSKGLLEPVILVRHALRNALLPILTIAGDEIVGLLNGSVAIELIFGWPGIGWLTLEAIQRRDFAVIQACVLFVALLVVGVNLVIDLLYAWADPRIRFA